MKSDLGAVAGLLHCDEKLERTALGSTGGLLSAGLITAQRRQRLTLHPPPWAWSNPEGRPEHPIESSWEQRIPRSRLVVERCVV